MSFLFPVLALLALLCLILFCDIAICIDYRKKLKLTLYVLGIPLDASRLLSRIKRKKKPQKEESEEISKPKEPKTRRPLLQSAEEFASFLAAILRAVRSVAGSLHRHLKVRVQRLNLTVASDDAAKTALNYGSITGLCDALFALGEESCNFKAKTDHIKITPDFESAHFSADFRLILRMKPIFLITTYVGAYLAFFEEILSLPDPNQSRPNPQKKRKDTNHE